MTTPGPCAALIPCRNEAKSLTQLLVQVRYFLPSILVVDDGSQDATAQIAIDAGAECIRWQTGRGKGAALQAGFQHLQKCGFTHAVTLDGDGQHSPHDIPRFLVRGRQTAPDLLVGARDLTSPTMPWPRRAANRAMSACLSLCAGHALPDSQCGFRWVHLRPALQLEATTRHFEYESELLLTFLRRGLRVGFVPVQTIYRAEQSKIRPLIDTWRWLRWYSRALKETSHDRFRKHSPGLPENSVCAEI